MEADEDVVRACFKAVSPTEQSLGQLPLVQPKLNNKPTLSPLMQNMRDFGGLGFVAKVSMGRHIARQVNRLPCLPSSNLMDDVITGRNLITMKDLLEPAKEVTEIVRPHVLVERALAKKF